MAVTHHLIKIQHLCLASGILHAAGMMKNRAVLATTGDAAPHDCCLNQAPAASRPGTQPRAASLGLPQGWVYPLNFNEIPLAVIRPEKFSLGRRGLAARGVL